MLLKSEVVGQELDSVAHRVEDVLGNLAWHQSTEDAAKVLLGRFGPRLLPVEVEDMLRPMLGGFKYFSRGETVGELPDRQLIANGLQRVLERMQELYRLVLDGKLLAQFDESYRKVQVGRGPLEVGANFAASIVLVGSAAADRLRQMSNGESHAMFELEPVDGGMWRWLFLMSSGGVQVDEGLARRMFKGVAVMPKGTISACRDFGLPIQLGLLSGIEGYESSLAQEVKAARDAVFAIAARAAVLCVLLGAKGRQAGPSESGEALAASSDSVSHNDRMRSASSHFAGHLFDLADDIFRSLMGRLAEAGMVSPKEINRRMRERRAISAMFDVPPLIDDKEIDELIGSVSLSLCESHSDSMRRGGQELIEALREDSSFRDLIEVLRKGLQRKRIVRRRVSRGQDS
jgi:hypothetical protein